MSPLELHAPRPKLQGETRNDTLWRQPWFLTRQLTLGAALLTTGLISGFFYAYACSVTLGLARLSDAQYVLAMQEISAAVRNPIFAFSYFGAALAL